MMNKVAVIGLVLCTMLINDSYSMDGDECDLSITSAGNIYWDEDIGGYNPFSGQTNTMTDNVSVFNSSRRKCDIHLTASSVNYSGRPQQRFAVKGDETIEYYLATSQSTNDRRQWWDYPDAKREKNYVLSAKVEGNQGASLPFYMIVPAGQQVSSGLYVDSSVIEVFKGKHRKRKEPKPGDFRDSDFIQITIPVSFFSQVNFESFNGGAEYYADLGILDSGTRHDFTMWVTHSAPFNIEARSENNGKLKHASTEQLLPYVFRYGSTVIPLGGGTALLAENQDPTFFRAYPLSISIETAVDGYSQGTYNDKIYIDLVSL